MLEKPNLADENIIARLRADFDFPIAQLRFLPLGADLGTAVYRAETDDGRAYFVKLRSGAFDPNTVRVPAFLAAQGISEIIAPLPTRDGALWATLETFRVIVYPFVDGQDGFAVKLSASQWNTFGAALAKIHAAKLPAEFSIARETFTPRWRELVTAYLERADTETFDDPIADELADIANIIFLLSEHTGIDLSDAIAEKMRKNALKYPAPPRNSGHGESPSEA